MAAKLVVVLAALVAAAHSSVIPLPVDADVSNFSYDVADPNTGDYKSQVESRVGGTVRGQYSLVDPDGTKRVVDYTADDVNGFNAVVRKDPLAVAISEVAAPTLYSAHSVVAPAPAVVASAPALYSAHSVIAPAPAIIASAPALYPSHSAVAPAPALLPAHTLYSSGHSVVPGWSNYNAPWTQQSLLDSLYYK